GSVGEAAKHLGLSEATLYRKIKKFGISRSFTRQEK
ncbi:MAG: helix-turn-helix domain-containing protein, partial [Planctomycetota bacterium]